LIGSKLGPFEITAKLGEGDPGILVTLGWSPANANAGARTP